MRQHYGKTMTYRGGLIVKIETVLSMIDGELRVLGALDKTRIYPKGNVEHLYGQIDALEKLRDLIKELI